MGGGRVCKWGYSECWRFERGGRGGCESIFCVKNIKILPHRWILIGTGPNVENCMRFLSVA